MPDLNHFAPFLPMISTWIVDSPLEAMAYDHQRGFDSGAKPYAVEDEVREQTMALTTLRLGAAWTQPTRRRGGTR